MAFYKARCKRATVRKLHLFSGTSTNILSYGQGVLLTAAGHDELIEVKAHQVERVGMIVAVHQRMGRGREHGE